MGSNLVQISSLPNWLIKVQIIVITLLIERCHPQIIVNLIFISILRSIRYILVISVLVDWVYWITRIWCRCIYKRVSVCFYVLVWRKRIRVVPVLLIFYHWLGI
eukprot:NODE_97_length_20652_cov_0.832093.p18 type:complete len:104 gc:universal NODE_97_length_20652_cov_0.832093:13690-14001(+)